MNDEEREFELKVTIAVAETTHFHLGANGKFYVCDYCGQRLMIYYVGKAINERMLDHFNSKHIKAVHE